MANDDNTGQQSPLEGLASFVLGIISIFFMSPIFVPLAAILGIIAVFKKQFVWGILGLFCALVGFITSPILMGMLVLSSLSGVFSTNQEQAIERPPVIAAQVIAAQKDTEADTLRRLSKSLSDDIQNITQTGIPQDVVDIKLAMEKAKNGVRDIEESLTTLKIDASVSPMTCYQAQQKVQYDFEQKLKYHWDQSLGTAIKQFRESVGQLEKRLENGDKVVKKTIEDAKSLEQAVKKRRYTQSGVSLESGAEHHPVEQYQLLISSARAQLPTWKAEVDSQIAKARKMMQEGQTLTQESLRSANCH